LVPAPPPIAIETLPLDSTPKDFSTNPPPPPPPVPVKEFPFPPPPPPATISTSTSDFPEVISKVPFEVKV
jgi:hypothetical protein